MRKGGIWHCSIDLALSRQPRDTLTTVELDDQPFAPTLAHKLGDIPHVSGLLRRIAQLSGAGDRVTDWLLKVAVERGANHYRRDFDSTLPADLPAISDEEIGVAFCLGQNPYDLDSSRVAAQFLSSLRINAARLCQLAVPERCEPVLLHIAEVAKKIRPGTRAVGFLAKTSAPAPSAAHGCFAALDAPRQPHRDYAGRPAAYETLKTQGLSITRDKAAVMRVLSPQFARGEMGHVYAAIVRLGE